MSSSTSKDAAETETSDERLLSVEDAADVLGVKPATIYTYVTRGNLEAHRLSGDRSSWFRRDDIDRLRTRTRSRRPSAHQLTTPESKITLIEDGYYWYRGFDPKVLAETRSFEQVAELIWTGTLPDSARWERVGMNLPGPVEADMSLLDRLRLASVHLTVSDPLRYSTSADSIRLIARRLLVGLVRALPVVGDDTDDPRFAAYLWPRLSRHDPTAEAIRALNAALIVMADHGMAPATRVARTAAGFRVDPHGIIESGLAVLAGGWHGGRSFSAEALIADIVRTGDAAVVVGEWFRRQGSIPSLGQPRYPEGDPRTGLILDFVREAAPDHPACRACDHLIEVTRARELPAPAVEFAIATMGAAFEFEPGATEAVFAIGRSAGWLGHAIEGYRDPERVSPSFNYTGVRPDTRTTEEQS